MKMISVEQVKALHNKMVVATGGSSGIRDINLLESALNNAFMSFGGEDLYKSNEEKCANICFGIINNHPFVDGNKRMGIYIMLILLELNAIRLNFTQIELIDLGLGAAEGKYKQDYIFNWIQEHKI